jgi:hypothetical protein
LHLDTLFDGLEPTAEVSSNAAAGENNSRGRLKTRAT